MMEVTLMRTPASSPIPDMTYNVFSAR